MRLIEALKALRDKHGFSNEELAHVLKLADEGVRILLNGHAARQGPNGIIRKRIAAVDIMMDELRYEPLSTEQKIDIIHKQFEEGDDEEPNADTSTV